MKKVIIYGLFLSLFLNMECRCDEETLVEGLETRVQGIVYDSLNRLPVANQKLIIGEYEDYFVFDGGHRVYFIQNLDSTYTDEKGNYDIVFSTSGQGSIYKIIPEQTNTVWTYYQEPVRIQNIESENEINFNFMNLYPCYLNITLNNIEHLPIDIFSPVALMGSGFTDDVNNLEEINMSTSSITRKIYLNRKRASWVNFIRKYNDTITQVASFSIPSFYESTTEYNINLTNEDFK